MNGKTARRRGKMVNRHEKLIFTEEFYNLEWVKKSKYYEKIKKEDIYGFETHRDHVEK